MYRWLRGRPTALLRFEDVVTRLHLSSQRDLGIQTVPLDRIVGSEGRAGEFNRLFLPRNPKLRERWKRIVRARHQDRRLPPVELTKVSDIYFVSDGNHRLSVARHLGQEEIDAHVIEVETNVPLTQDLDQEDLQRKGAQSQFVEQTRLLQIHPGFVIPTEASDPDTYREFMRHIDDHRRSIRFAQDKSMAAEQGREIGQDEAVRHYFDAVYRPQIDAMRRLHTAAAFPRRTETNLYLSIMKHRRRRAAKHGRDPGPEAAVVSFMGRFGTWNRRGRFKRRTGLRDWLLTWLQHLRDAWSRLVGRER